MSLDRLPRPDLGHSDLGDPESPSAGRIGGVGWRSRGQVGYAPSGESAVVKLRRRPRAWIHARKGPYRRYATSFGVVTAA